MGKNKSRKETIKSKVLLDAARLYKKSKKKGVIPNGKCKNLNNEDRKYLGYQGNTKVTVKTVAKKIGLPSWNSKSFFDLMVKETGEAAKYKFTNLDQKKSITKQKKIIESKLLNVANGSYISKANQDKNSIPNKKVLNCLTVEEKVLLNVDPDKDIDLKTALDAIGMPALNSKELFDMIFDKYGVPKKNWPEDEVKVQRQEKPYETLLAFLAQFDDEYFDFITSKYKTLNKINAHRGIIKKMYPAFKKPSKRTLVSAFALDVLQDTHGLDKDGSKAYFEDMLMFLYNDIDYEKHNLYKSFTGSIIVTNNIVANCRFNWVTLNSLNVEELEFIKDKDIYVFENTGVSEEFGINNPNVPIICTGGFLNSTARLLFTKLLGNNNTIHYCGDLDLAGIKIADNIVREFPNIVLYKNDVETYERYKEFAITPTIKQNISDDIKHPELKSLYDLIKRENKFIYQESIDYSIEE